MTAISGNSAARVAESTILSTEFKTPTAVEQFDTDRTSRAPRGTGGSTNANMAPAAFDTNGKQVAAAAPLANACQAPEPIIYAEKIISSAPGSRYDYRLPDIQLAPTSGNHIIPVTYHVGGNDHHVWPGDLHSSSVRTMLAQPTVYHEPDTITVHATHQVIDGRQRIDVAQDECQLIPMQPTGAPSAATGYPSKEGALPLPPSLPPPPASQGQGPSTPAPELPNNTPPSVPETEGV